MHGENEDQDREFQILTPDDNEKTFCFGCATRRLYGTNTFDLYTSSLEPLPWIRDSPQKSTRKEAARMGTHHS
jgi:hypothetical protein